GHLSGGVPMRTSIVRTLALALLFAPLPALAGPVGFHVDATRGTVFTNGSTGDGFGAGLSTLRIGPLDIGVEALRIEAPGGFPGVTGPETQAIHFGSEQLTAGFVAARLALPVSAGSGVILEGGIGGARSTEGDATWVDTNSGRTFVSKGREFTGVANMIG